MIRPLELDDAEALAALYTANRQRLAPYEPERDDAFFTAAVQRERIAREPHRFAILDADGALAGTIGIMNVVRGASQSATVGYWVDGARTGRGLAGRALAAVVEHAFGALALHRLQAPVQPANAASRRVLERGGFELIGLARGFLHVGGTWRDHLLYQRRAA